MKSKNIVYISALLFLVSCSGVNNSSSSTQLTGSTQSSSSITSITEVVSSLNISTETNLLRQSFDSILPATIFTSVNNGTSSRNDLVYEWFVNGKKSSQRASSFEFIASSDGIFQVQALVNGISSNILVFNITKPSFEISNIKFLNSTNFEVKAPEGAIFELPNKNVNMIQFLPDRGLYLINLKEPLKQGDNLNLVVSKSGFSTITRNIRFDTRQIAINQSTLDGLEVEASALSVFDIEKPHVLRADGTKTIVELAKVLTISFKSENLDGEGLSYTIENTARPANAPVINRQQGQVNVFDDNAGNINFEFRVNVDTVVGNYNFRVSIENTLLTFSVRVTQPTPIIEFNDYEVEDEDFNLVLFDGLKTDPTILNNETGVALENGIYKIFKPILNYEFKEFKFSTNALNFNVPTNLIDNSVINPNQLSVSIVGPSNVSTLRTIGVSQVSLPTIVPMRAVVNNFEVKQRLDINTAPGRYVYSLKVLQAGVEIYLKEVVVEIIDPIPTIKFVTLLEDENLLGSEPTIVELETNTKNIYRYDVQKPARAGLDKQTVIINSVVVDFESQINVGSAANNSYIGKTQLGDDQTVRVLMPFKKNYTGPSTLDSANNIIDTLIALELGKEISVTSYTEANEDGSRYVNSRVSSDENKYPFFRALDSNEIIIEESFVFEIDHLTAPGTYTFSILIGENSNQVIINVLPATPMIKLNFSNDSNVVYDEVLKEYFISLDAEDLATVNLELEILNTQLPTTNSLFMRVESNNPSGSDNIVSSSFTVENKPGNDGHLLSPGVVSALQNGQETIDLSEVGKYSYKVSLGTISSELVLNVLPYPTLTLNSLLFNKEVALRLYDDNFIISYDGEEIDLIISASPVNLADESYYLLSETNTFSQTTVESLLTEIVLDEFSKFNIDYTLDTIIFTDQMIISKVFYVGLYEKDSDIQEQFNLIGSKEIKIWITNLE